MRIHLSLEPKHFQSTPSGPLAKIGGDLVLIELQGRIEVEGDTANSVIGVLGLDRPVSLLTFRFCTRALDTHAPFG